MRSGRESTIPAQEILSSGLRYHTFSDFSDFLFPSALIMKL